ncbi:efflux RND transporter permease subunit [Methylocella silvestris]
MIGIVRLALSRLLTFVVMAILIAIYGALAILKTPTDIFPNIGIPVVSVIWTYNGLPPDDMAGRIISSYERAVSTTVNDIEHIESQSFVTYGLVKIYFQPTVDVSAAQAQVTAISQTILKQLPAGINPPQILVYNASSVPIIQLALSSDSLPEARLNDLAANFIRPQLASIPGAQMPSPYGGAARQAQIDLDQKALRAHNLSAQDIVDALVRQNIITPVGTQKIGRYEYTIDLNDSPKRLREFNDIPIKVVNGAVVFMRDVAFVHDGSPPQTNIVQMDGAKGVLISVVKNGSASTLDIIDGVKKALPAIEASLPPGVRLKLVNDQSAFVKSSVTNVVREGVIAASLTGLMILVFLGSWRSTLIITISIPLAILSSLVFLSLTGQTINVMTLGGLALAVGILVDDATVTIENINRHLHRGDDIETAIVEGAREIMPPATVSLLCICIAFVPLLSLGGVAGYLFRPLALAVVSAMVASYVLTYTLTPTMARALLSHAASAHGDGAPQSRFARAHARFEHVFEAVQSRYAALLSWALVNRKAFVAGFLCFCAVSLLLIPFLGQEFFPAVDAGILRIHMRAHAGTRIEETARIASEVEQEIRQTIPKDRLETIVDNIGLPNSGINLSYANSGTIGVSDADILVTLAPGEEMVATYQTALRQRLRDAFPGVSFAFLPGDMVTQILNFGAPAPIDVQIAGFDAAADRAYAEKLFARINHVPGAVDARVQQVFEAPALKVDFNRDLAGVVGLTEHDASTSLQDTLSGSSQSTPIYWLNPKNGVSYPVSIQTPQYAIDTLPGLQNVLVSGPTDSQLLGAVATITPEPTPSVVTHYNIQPTIDIYASAEGRDLGAVRADVEKIVSETRAEAPKGATVVIRGEAATMTSAYRQLLFGLGFSILLIYLLIVVNFQSWLDSLVIILSLPAALAGIVWMLFITRTPLSAPALTGAIMCMGVATANSILVISFAREELARGVEPAAAALAAGAARFRPVLMTALAMIIGMTPMAIEPGQNMPLGRAVIGGLMLATCATLVFAPVLFALLRAPRSSSATMVASAASDAFRLLEGDPMPSFAVAPPSSRRLRILVLGFALAIVAVAVSGVMVRAKGEQEIAARTEELAVPRVRLVTPTRGPKETELTLPGDVAAFNTGSIYARASGYVTSWKKDIGDRVKKGDVLATIDSPEVDQQLVQARAVLVSAEADARLAKVTSERWSSLVGRNIVSKQADDEKQGALAARNAAVEAAQANVARLEALASFEQLEAPFDGVVTARAVEIGDLVDSGQKSGQPLFKVSDIHAMRIYVKVPQAYIGVMEAGLKATLDLPGRQQTFEARLVSTSDAITKSSRTALVELEAPNPDGKLWPGAFVEAHFHLPGDPRALRVPATALIFGPHGMSVATAGPDEKVVIKPVQLGRNLGEDVEVRSGIGPSDRIIDSPQETLVAGDLVRPVETADASPARPDANSLKIAPSDSLVREGRL